MRAGSRSAALGRCPCPTEHIPIRLDCRACRMRAVNASSLEKCGPMSAGARDKHPTKPSAMWVGARPRGPRLPRAISHGILTDRVDHAGSDMSTSICRQLAALSIVGAARPSDVVSCGSSTSGNPSAPTTRRPTTTRRRGTKMVPRGDLLRDSSTDAASDSTLPTDSGTTSRGQRRRRIDRRC